MSYQMIALKEVAIQFPLNVLIRVPLKRSEWMGGKRLSRILLPTRPPKFFPVVFTK